MAINTTDLRQKRQKIVVDMRQLQDGIIERGEETAEDREKFDKMTRDIDSLTGVIEREERVLQLEQDAAQSLSQRKQSGTVRYELEIGRPSQAEIERRVSFALQGWLQQAKPGKVELREEHLQAAKYFNLNLSAREIELPIARNYRSYAREIRDMDTSTGTKGGETIPEGFVRSLEVALLTHGGVRNVATILRTSEGNNLPWPTMNDTSNKGEIIDEAASFGTSVDPSFGQVVFKAFKYSSKPILVSFELLQDSAFDIGAILGEATGTRIARIQNDHFTTGGGTTLPEGIVVGSSEGVEAASQTVLTTDEVIDLEHSVDPAYRPGAMWMMHDKTLAEIRKLKNVVDGQYLWQPGLQAGIPDRILGYTYQINQSMASALAQAAKVLLFGQMSKYKVRDVASIRLRRLDELYAATDQVAFVAFLRSDGQLLDAGTAPVRHLTMKKS